MKAVRTRTRTRTRTRRRTRTRAFVIAGALALAAAAGAAGCAPDLDVGSDVLWSARYEAGTFDEWTAVPGRGAEAFPPPNAIEVSSERAHHGSYAVKLTIDASTDSEQENALLSRAGGLPAEAYYSAWYYLPRSVTVGGFWVIFKFRQRAVASDATTAGELWDLDLLNLPSGEMTLLLYDHRTLRDVPLDVPDPVVPVGAWFHIEAFYRNAPDTTGHLTYWLDGRQIKDISGQAMAPNDWIEWDTCSIGENLAPNPAVIFIDDCAVSRTRVGPTGIIAR
jgi:hypothetical protein